MNLVLRKTIALTLALIIAYSPFISIQKTYGQGAPVVDIPNTTINGLNLASEKVQTGKVLKDIAKDITKQVAQRAAVNLLKKFTEETVNWINQGNDGKPLYLTDTKSFFDNVADEQIKLFTAEVGFDPENHPYGKDFIVGYIQAYKRKKLNPLATNNYNLPKTCESSFSWRCWEGQVSNPANNPFGDFIQKSNVLNREIDKAISNIDKELAASGGFLSVKICEAVKGQPTLPPETYTDTTPGNIPNTGGSGLGAIYNQQQELDAIMNEGVQGSSGTNGGSNTGQGVITTGTNSNQASVSGLNTTQNNPSGAPCAKWRTETPGAIVGDKITKALNVGTEQSVLASALGNSVSVIFDTLYNKFIGEGLNNLSNNLFNINEQGEEDMWNYYGESLGGPISSSGGGSSTSSLNWAGGPDMIIDIYQLLGLPYPDGSESGTEGDVGGSSSTNIYKPILISSNTVSGTANLFALTGVDVPTGTSTSQGLTSSENGTAIGSTNNTNTQNGLFTLYSVSDIASSATFTTAVNPLGNTSIEPLSAIELTRQESVILKESTDILKVLPSALYHLDRCLPGPDYGWETRFQEEFSREMSGFYEKMSRKDENKDIVRTANVELSGIKNRFNLAVLAIKDNMFTHTIPSAIEIYDTVDENVNEISNYEEKYGQYFEKVITQKRLEVIRGRLQSGEITANEAIYEYLQIQDKVSTLDSLAVSVSERNNLKDKIIEIEDYKVTCQQEANQIRVAHPVNEDTGTTGWSFWDGFHGIYYDHEEDNPYHKNGEKTFPAHLYFYCKNIINGCPEASDDNDGITTLPEGSTCINLDNVYKQDNFEAICHNFYSSNVADYFKGN
jgi:hypothetical protein